MKLSALGMTEPADETPETVLAAQEIAAAVNAAMEALPEDLRQAVTLREIEGLSYEEIALAMNCPLARCVLAFFVRGSDFGTREAFARASRR